MESVASAKIQVKTGYDFSDDSENDSDVILDDLEEYQTAILREIVKFQLEQELVKEDF